MLRFRLTCEINRVLSQHKNNKHSVKHAANLKKTFCIHEIRVNSPKFNSTNNWKVTVKG